MQMLNEAIEGASVFKKFMEELKADADKQTTEASADMPDADEARRWIVVSSPPRQPGENRAAHRARLKRERRAPVERK